MNKKLSKYMAALLVMTSVSLPLAAHADEWKNVPHSLYFKNGTTVTSDMIADQRGPVLKHCLLNAYETIPSRERAILGHAFTTGAAGGLGDAAGTLGEAAVLGSDLVKTAIQATGFFGFLSNVFFGGFQGDAQTNERFRSSTDSCLARAAGGIYTMAPSEADEILRSGPRLVGQASNWTRPDKSGNVKVAPGTNESPTQ